MDSSQRYREGPLLCKAGTSWGGSSVQVPWGTQQQEPGALLVRENDFQSLSLQPAAVAGHGVRGVSW